MQNRALESFFFLLSPKVEKISTKIRPFIAFEGRKPMKEKSSTKWKKPQSVWPGVDIKSCPKFPKVAQKVSHTSFFLIMWCFSKKPKSYQIFLAIFDQKIDTENFPKSPNLVTLVECDEGLLGESMKIKLERTQGSSY